jgi:outer membrane protein assembly factor BamB
MPAFADVPVYKADAARTGVMRGPGPVNAPEEAWRTPLDCAVTDHTPVLADGLVLVGCDAPKLFAVDARTGARRWTAPLDGAVLGSPGVADGVVFAADLNGSLTAIDLETGEERWAVPVHPFRHPGVVDGTLYVGTTDGRVLGLDPATGHERWAWRAPAGVKEITATVVGDTVFASADDGHLYAVALADGSTLWRHRVLSGRVSTPAVTSGVVYVSGLQNGSGRAGGLYALDRATGAELWRTESPSGEQLAPPTVADGVVYAPARNDGLFALDAATGSVRWVAGDTGHVGGQAPAITGTTVYLAADRTIGAYDRVDGRELWTVDLGEALDGGVIVSGGMAFVGDNAGDLVAYAEPALVAQIAATAPTETPSVAPSASLEPPAVAVLERVATWTKDAIGTGRTSGLDVGPDGLVYIVAADISEIIVVDPSDGSVARRWGEPGSGDGQFDFLRDSGDDLGGVAVAADGTVFVADALNRRVQVFDANGTFVRQWGRFGKENGQFLEPTDVAVAPDGDVYVVDDQRDDIQRFSSEGTWKATIGEHGSGDGQLNFTGGITVDANGILYNADWSNHRVQAWDDAGRWLWSLGSRGSGPGQFGEPADVGVDAAGRIYVHDVDNIRVQAFGPDRAYLGELPVEKAYMLAAGDADVYVGGISVLRLHILEP